MIDPRDADQVLSLLRRQFNVPVRGSLLVSFNPDTNLDASDVRPSILLDVIEGGEIVLAQTEPQVLKSMIGEEVVLSSVARNDKGPARFGMRAHITRIEKLTLLYDRQETVVLMALTPPAQVVPFNARTGVRIELDGHSLLTFSSSALSLIPLNISIGGVGFFVPKNLVKKDELLEIVLDLPGHCVPAVVRVVRVNAATNRLDYVGAAFLEKGKTACNWPIARTALQSAIMAEQARQIARAKGIDWN